MVCCELFQSEEFSLVSVLCMWTCSSPVIFERNSGFSLKALAHTDMDLLLLFPQYAEHKFGSSVMHAQFVLPNALNWPRWNSHQTSSLMDSNSSVFEYLFLHLIWSTFKSVFLVNGCPEHYLFSAEVTLLLNLKNTQTPHCLPSNSPFSILKAKFVSYILYFQQSCAEFFWSRK